MIPPRALTWLHLLPADAAYTCTSGPAWLREALVSRGNPGGGRITIEWGRKAADIASLDGVEGLVGVNCRALSVAALQSSGFSHVRRLAVLPNLEYPRWLIPLDAPAVSAAAFNLYTPARLAARFKRFAAQAAAYTRLPVWYRDHILIALRRPPPLEIAVRKLFPDCSPRIALSAGAPEGARNRKVSAAVIDEDGQILAFLKLAISDLSRRLLRHEASMLRALPNVAPGRLIAPGLMAAEEIDGIYVTAQTPLTGRPAPLDLKSPHVRFLDRLSCGEIIPAGETDLVRDLHGRLAALPCPRPELRAALELAVSTLHKYPSPVGLVHGDFAPWNLRQHCGNVAAFDWEYGHLSGPAGLDEIHYRLQVGYLLRGWSVEQAFHELCQPDALQSCPTLRNRAATCALATVYIADVLARLFGEGYDATNQMVAWTLQLLSRLTPVAPVEVAIA